MLPQTQVRFLRGLDVPTRCAQKNSPAGLGRGSFLRLELPPGRDSRTLAEKDSKKKALGPGEPRAELCALLRSTGGQER
jgi:hypothetical protein